MSKSTHSPRFDLLDIRPGQVRSGLTATKEQGSGTALAPSRPLGWLCCGVQGGLQLFFFFVLQRRFENPAASAAQLGEHFLG